jgi:hypothetical protein
LLIMSLGPGALLQQAQQRRPDDGRHAVAAAAQPLALEADLDLVPVPAMLFQGLAQHRVGRVDGVQGPVREHDAEPERVVGAVALEHRDLRRRVRPPHQRREEQPARPASRHRDPHGARSLLPRSQYARHPLAAPI